ncbi:MAG: hypothetical protein M0004_02340 [Actinomycetota bacterium]|nr:hypothetical protein [Actinomycetota bacterium]
MAFVTAIFTVFVAEYAHLRAELTRAEHELNFTTPGRLAASRLGRTVAREAVESALVASIASFAGGMLPLVVGASIPRYSWCSLLAAFAGLGMLGVALARSGGGDRLTWSVALVVCGIVVTFVGAQLKIA